MYDLIHNLEGIFMRMQAALVAILAVTAQSGARAADAPAKPLGGLLLVANKGDHTLGIIDPALGKQVATVLQTGVTGHEVIASPDGKTAYVPIYGNSGVGKPGTDGQTLDVIDIASRRVVTTIDFGKAERPHCPHFGADGKLYVSTEITNSISVIDPATNKIVGKIPTDHAESHMFAITKDGKRAFTANVHPGSVSAIDLVAKKVTATLPISDYSQRIALSVDDRRVFNADQTQPRLAVIDTATLKVEQWVTLPSAAYGTAPTPDGRFLVMALPGVNKVGILDLKTLQVTRTFDVPKAPQEVLVRPDGLVAYVSCDASHQVAEIDLKEWKVGRLIEAGPGADGLAWASAKP
jgi:YVTN family beta-propeller protein